jgi:hypothetical protein
MAVAAAPATTSPPAITPPMRNGRDQFLIRLARASIPKRA